MFLNVVTWSQSKDQINKDDYILISKTTHEELRKNIEDYKNLISTYDKLKFDYDNALEANTLDKEKIISYQNQLIGLKEQILNQSLKIDDLNNKLKELGEKYQELNGYYRNSMMRNDRYKAELYQIRGYKNRFQTQGIVIGFLTVALLIVISQK